MAYYIDWSLIFASIGGKSANYGGKSARLFTRALQLPKERSYFLSDNFYFIYLFFNFARLIIGYSLFTLLPFFFVSFCQSNIFHFCELASLLPIFTLCKEIGFLLAIMSLIPEIEFDPEDEGLVPSILTDKDLSLLGQAANITAGLVPGLATVSFYLYSLATFCCVAILKFNCFDCSYINLYSVATVIF